MRVFTTFFSVLVLGVFTGLFAQAQSDAASAAGSSLQQAEELFKKQQFEQAKEMLKAVVAQNSQEVAAYKMLREIARFQNDRKLEAEYLEQLVSLEPSKENIEDALSLFEKAGDKEKELFFHEKFVGLNLGPQDKTKLRISLDKLAVAYEEKKNDTALYDVLVRLIEIAPKNEHYHFKKGRIDLERANLKAAFNEFNVVKSISPAYPDNCFYLGESAYKLEKFDIAADELKKASIEKPLSGEPALHLADSFEKINNEAEAARVYEEVLKTDPKNKEIIEKLIGIYERQKNNVRLVQLYGDYQAAAGTRNIDMILKEASIQRISNTAKAIILYEEALTIDASNEESYKALIELYDIRNERAKVAKYLNEYLKVKPDAQGNKKLSQIYLDLKDSAKAIEPLERYTALQANDLSQMYLLANLYLSVKQDEKASDVLAQLVSNSAAQIKKVGINEAELYELNGSVLQRTGKKAEAVAAYEQALKMNPMMGEAWYYVGAYYLDQQEWQKAIDALLKLKALGLHQDDVTRGLAKAMYLSGREQDAIPYLEKILEKSPDNKDVMQKLATVYLSMNQIEKASEYLKKLGSDAESAFAGNRAAAEGFIKAGNDASARKLLQQVVEQKPDDEVALRLLADLEIRNKDNKAGVEVLEKLYLLKTRPELRKEIGDLQLSLGRDSEAAAAYESYVLSGKKDRAVLDALLAIYEKNKDADKAYPVLRTLVTLAGKSDAYWFKKGVIEFDRKDYKSAAGSFDEVRKINASYNRLSYFLGESFYNAGNFGLAEGPLAQVVASDPKNIELLGHLAVCYERNKKLADAAGAYEKILTLNPKDAEVVQRLIGLYEAQKNTVRLVELYDRLLSLTQKDKAVLLKLGRLYLSQKQGDRAIKVYEDILGMESGNEEALNALSDLYEERKDYKSASKTLGALISVKPSAAGNLRLAGLYLVMRDSASAVEPLERYTAVKATDRDNLYLLARCYISQKYFGKAEFVLEKVVGQINPKNQRSVPSNAGEIYLAYATALEGNGKGGEAIAAYEQAVTFDKKNGEAFYKIGVSYHQSGHFEKAIPALQAALSLKVREDEVIKRLGDAYYNAKNLKAALPYLERDNAKNAGNAETLERLATAYLSIKDATNAVKYLKVLNQKDPGKFGGSYLAAYAFVMQKDDKSAQPILEKYCADNGSDDKALRMLADLYKRQNNAKGAVEVLEKLNAAKSSPELQKEIGDLQLSLGRDSEAAAAYESYVLSGKKDRAVLDALLAIYEKNKDADKAYPVLRTLVTLAGKSDAYWFKKGVIEFDRKDYKSAAGSFDEVRKINASYNRLSYFLGESFYNAGNFGLAEGPLAQVVASDPKNIELLGHLAVCYERNKKLADAAGAYEKILTLNPKDAEVVQRLIGLYEAQKNTVRLVELYDRLLSLTQKDKAVLLKLGRLYLSQKQGDRAIKVYEDILGMESGNEEALNALSDLYEERKDYKSASKTLGALISVKPSAAGNLRLAGLYLVMRDSASAVEPLERYTAVKATDRDNLYLLARCYISQKDFGKAEFVLEKVVGQINPKNQRSVPSNAGEIYLAYATALEGNGKGGEAIAAYEQAVTFDKKNGEAFYKIGVSYHQSGQFEKAIPALQAALSLKVREDEVIKRLGDAYYNAKNLKAALPYLERDNAKNAGNAETLERLVNAYLSVQDAANAVKYLKVLNQKDPGKFGGSYLAAYAFVMQKDDKSAQPILEKYCADNGSDDKALRMLADLYKRQNNAKGAVEVLEKMYAAKARPELKKEVGDLLVKIDLPNAAEAYEIYIKTNPKDKQVLLALRDLYEALKHDESLNPVLQRLLVLDPSNEALLSRIGDIDFANKRYKEAVTVYAQVVKRNPKNSGADLVLGESYYNLNQYALAEPFLVKAVERNSNDVDLTLHLAQVFEKNKKTNNAADTYEKVFAKRQKDIALIDKLISLNEALGNKARLIELYRTRQDVSGKKDKDQLLKLGAIYLAQKKTNDAITTFEAVLLLDKENIAALQALADLYEQNKNLKEASSRLEQLIALKPDADLYLRLAHMYIDMKDSTKAIDPLEKYTAAKKIAPVELYVLGKCYLTQKAADKAENALLKAQDQAEKTNKELFGVALKTLYGIYSAKGDNDNIKKTLVKLTVFDPKNADYNYELGERFYRDKAYDAALKSLLVANAVSPNLRNAPLMIGTILYMKKQGKQALPYLQVAEKADAKNNDVHRMLAGIYSENPATFNLAANQYETVLQSDRKDIESAKSLMALYEKQKRQKELVPVYERILELEPANKVAWLKLGTLAADLKDDARTERAFLKVVELDLKNLQEHITLGEFYEARKKSKEAIGHYLKVIEQKPKNQIEFERRVGELYLAANDTANAETYFSKVIETDPYQHEVSFKLGVITQEKKNYTGAASYFELAAEAKPEIAKYNFRAGLCYFKQSDYPNAKRLLLVALKRDPKIAEANFMVGQILMTQDAFAAAILYFGSANKYKPDDLDYLKFYAEAAFKAKNYPQAIPLYKTLLAKKADDFESRANLGRCFMYLKQNKEALGEFDKVFTGRVQLIEDEYAIGELYFMEKRSTEAQRILVNVLRTHPENADAQQMVAEIFEANGDKQKAIDHYDEAVKADKKRSSLLKRVGALYSGLAKEDKTITSWEEYLKSNNDVEVAKKLLAIYKKNNRIEDVRRMYSIIARVDTKDADNLMNLGLLDYEFKKQVDALGSFNRVLALNPNHKEALYMAGKIYFEIKDYTKALPKLTVAVRVDPSSIKAALCLADLYYETKKADEAIEFYKKISVVEPRNEYVLDRLVDLYRIKKQDGDLIFFLKQKTELNAKAGDAWVELGVFYRKARRNEEAEVAFKKGLDIKGENYDAFVNLAEMFVEKKRVEEAIEYYKKAIYVQSKIPVNYMKLGRIYLSKGDSTAAMDAFEKVLQYDQNSGEAISILGNLYVSFNYQDKAISTFQKIVKANPKDPSGYKALARSYLGQSKYREAEANLNNALRLSPKDAQALYLMGDLYNAQKDHGRAIAYYGKAYQLNPDDIDNAGKYADALYEDKNFKTALPVLLRLKAQSKSDPRITAVLMDCYLSLGDHANAMKYVDILEKADPKLLAKNFKVAVAFYKLNKFDKAQSILEAMGPQKNKEYYNMLANIYISKKKWNDAADAMKELLAQDPSDLKMSLQLGDIYENRGDDELAVELYKKMETPYPRELLLKERLVKLYKKLGSEKVEDLRISLNEAIGLNPKNADYLFELAAIMFNDGQMGEARAKLSQVVTMLPSHPQANALLGRIFLENKDFGRAEQYLLIAAKTMEKDPVITRSLGELYLQTKRYDKERSYLEATRAANPQDMGTIIKLAEAYEKLNLNDALFNLYITITKKDPTNVVAHKGLGDIYYGKKQFKDAMSEYRIVVQLKNDDVKVLNRQAGMLLDIGKIDEAVGLFRSSLQYSPNQPDIAYKLGVIFLNNRGNEEAAKEQFERVILIDPKNGDAYKMLAAIYLQGNDRASAVRYFQQALSVNPNDIESMSKLADLMVKDGDIKEAEPILVKAVAANPKDIQSKISLGRLYLNTKRFKEAEPLLAAAEKAKPADLQLMMDVIKIYNGLGQFAQVIPRLEKLVQSGQATNDVKMQLGIAYFGKGEVAKAKKILEELLTKIEGSVEAYQILATIYYSENDLRKAKIVFRKMLDLDKANPEANFYLGELAYADKDYDLAVVYYEMVLASDPNREGITDHLAECYVIQGNYEKAKTFIKAGLKKDSKNGMLLLNYGKVLFAEENYKESLKFLSLATKAMPGNDEPAYFYLMALVKLEDVNAALNLSKEFVAKFKSSDKIYFATGSAFMLAKQADKALKAFQLALKLNPNYRDAYKKCGDIYFGFMKDNAAAVANYKRYVSLGGNSDDIPRLLRDKMQ